MLQDEYESKVMTQSDSFFLFGFPQRRGASIHLE